VFEHLVGLGVKPNAMSYSLLVDAHLINRDPKAALSVIDEMVTAFFYLLYKLVFVYTIRSIIPGKKLMHVKMGR
jgi:pentatricopeptide repeat protein